MLVALTMRTQWNASSANVKRLTVQYPGVSLEWVHSFDLEYSASKVTENFLETLRVARNWKVRKVKGLLGEESDPDPNNV